jgi:hypothetical protein
MGCLLEASRLPFLGGLLGRIPLQYQKHKLSANIFWQILSRLFPVQSVTSILTIAEAGPWRPMRILPSREASNSWEFTVNLYKDVGLPMA